MIKKLNKPLTEVGKKINEIIESFEDFLVQYKLDTECILMEIQRLKDAQSPASKLEGDIIKDCDDSNNKGAIPLQDIHVKGCCEYPNTAFCVCKERKGCGKISYNMSMKRLRNREYYCSEEYLCEDCNAQQQVVRPTGNVEKQGKDNPRDSRVKRQVSQPALMNIEDMKRAFVKEPALCKCGHSRSQHGSGEGEYAFMENPTECYNQTIRHDCKKFEVKE